MYIVTVTVRASLLQASSAMYIFLLYIYTYIYIYIYIYEYIHIYQLVSRRSNAIEHALGFSLLLAFLVRGSFGTAFSATWE